MCSRVWFLLVWLVGVALHMVVAALLTGEPHPVMAYFGSWVATIVWWPIVGRGYSLTA